VVQGSAKEHSLYFQLYFQSYFLRYTNLAIIGAMTRPRSARDAGSGAAAEETKYRMLSMPRKSLGARSSSILLIWLELKIKPTYIDRPISVGTVGNVALPELEKTSAITLLLLL
jgi:hypothetical protein